MTVVRRGDVGRRLLPMANAAIVIVIAFLLAGIVYQLSGYELAKVIDGTIQGALTAPGAIESTLRWTVPLLLLAPLAYDLLAHRRPIVVTPALPWIALFLVVQLLSSIAAADVGAAAGAAGAFLLEGLVL